MTKHDLTLAIVAALAVKHEHIFEDPEFEPDRVVALVQRAYAMADTIASIDSMTNKRPFLIDPL